MNPRRARPALFGVIAFALVQAGAHAQNEGEVTTGTIQEEMLAPVASEGGRAELLPPRPVAEENDSVNRRVAADTVEGLVLTITIDGDAVRLDAAVPARVPKKLARTRRDTGADLVFATALASGQVVGRSVVPDTLINASEGDGLVRTPVRQIALVLATERAVDTVTIEAPATGARAELDVRGAYAEICRADPASRWCPGRR